MTRCAWVRFVNFECQKSCKARTIIIAADRILPLMIVRWEGLAPAWSRVAKSHRRRTSPAASSIVFLLIPQSSSSSSLPLLLVHPPKILFTNALWAWAPSATRVNPNYTLVELEWRWSSGVGATLQTALGGCVGATGVQSRQHLQSNFCNPLLLLLLQEIQHSESKTWSGNSIFSAYIGKTSHTNH